MRTATISTGGQLSIPAEIRHRWGVGRVILEDLGDAIIVRPLPDDPIAAARGSLRRPAMTTERARNLTRNEEGDRRVRPPRK
jgi:bifunctional DNA-binding transcriptional regulator/antitoxin component of YhaV-PrlF toxin-antitoxin module